MAKKHLTDAAVERYPRPQSGRTEVSDSEPGLFLWITANGAKSWTVIYRLPDDGGKRTQRRKSVVGRWPAMSVSDARERAREIMRLAAEGIDPEALAEQERAAAQLAESERQAETFGAVAAAWVKAMRSGRLTGKRKRPVAQATIAMRESLLRRNVLPTLGEVPMNDVTQPMVARLLNKLEQQGGSVDETLKAIRGVIVFAPEAGVFLERNPTADLRARQAVKKQTRALTDDELRSIWQAAGEQGWPFGSVIRLLMLTGQRKNEIAGLTWDEVDLERKLIVLPKERVKNRKGAHEVALSEPAMQVLEAAGAIYDALHSRKAGGKPEPRKGLVFPSDTGETPISGWNKLKAALERRVKGNLAGLSEEDHRAIRAGGALRADTVERKKAALARVAQVETEAWRIHDLRHTFITRARDGEENAEGEIVWSAPLDVLQAAVNHEITAGVTAAYDHGDIQRRYRLRKRELMDWWARKLMVIVEEN